MFSIRSYGPEPPHSGLLRPTALRGLSVCHHRALLSHEALGAHSGSMKELTQLRLICSQCTGRDFEMFVVQSQGQAEEFIAGADLSQFRPVPQGPAPW